ncbi:copper chaperone PCu(A)C [Aliarcobacter lanthieri]|uniref:copper chaperone PCu(A)C n=1 Tax=Aliarcobacter lanthieri TaxID=1355374 RepID=UPI000479B288|nr:copper chaperone PCu(A)C [Aliarcobacter lanthieri]
MKKIIFLLSLGTMFISASVIDVKEPYIRATPPNMKNTAAFMTFENKTEKDVSLVKASSNVAKFVELHTHNMKDGVMTMYEVEKIDILAHSNTVLKPSGFHIMFIDLNKSLQEGEKVDLTLEFSNGEKQNIQVEVKNVMNGMKSHHNHH